MKKEKFKIVEVSNDFHTNFRTYYMIMVRTIFGYWKPMKIHTVIGVPEHSTIDHNVLKCKIMTFNKTFALTIKEWLSNSNKNKVFWYDSRVPVTNASISNINIYPGGYVFGRKFKQEYLFFGRYIINDDVKFFEQDLTSKISECLPEYTDTNAEVSLNHPRKGIYNEQPCICHKTLTIGDEEVAFITREAPDGIKQYFLNEDDRIKYGLEDIKNIEVIPAREIFVEL